MRTTILENQAGVLIEKGAFVRVLGPGRVRYSVLFKKQQVRVFDIRPVYTSIADNYLTSDQATVAITVGLGYVISSPMEYLKYVNDAYGLIKLATSDIIRMWVNGKTLDELLEQVTELSDILASKLPETLQPYGLTTDRVSPPVVALPKNLRQAIEAKMVATKKSAADMEEARGRTAVLRHYANAARLVQEQPDLLKLLLGQKAKSLQIQFGTDKPAK